MRVFLRLVIVSALAWLAYVLLLQAHALQRQENPDPTTNQTIIMLFGGVTVLALIIGTITALSLLPALGESLANLFYGPNVEIEKDPHSEAVAKCAQGDFEGAIDAYMDIFENNHSDVMALSEVIHIYCDRLHDYNQAAKVLEEALQEEYPLEDSAFLCNRLVDVYWLYQHDARKARQLLIQVAENMPNTKHAANAQHRLQQIDHMLELGQVPQRPSAPEEVA
jgi:hypothetical protein